nr:MAG TPA: PTS system, cellobiose-specific IIB component [Caudoviricetes sp.]
MNESHYHQWVLPEGGPATGRLARGKRLVFRNQGHHHHVRRSLI